MPERPDLRKIAADIREALESYPREALADILTYVFQAYVVEGTPSIQAAQPERFIELEGLSFAEVITALQTRLDLPELALFEVSAGRVTVRAGGQAVPLVAQGRGAAQPLAPPPEPAPVGAPQEAPAAAPPPRPGVRVEEVPSSQLRPPPRAPAAPAAEAPPPRRGLSVTTDPGSRPGGTASRPDGGPPAPRPGGQAEARPDGGPPRPGAPGAPAQPGQAKPAAEPADEGNDSASKRFSLLDID